MRHTITRAAVIALVFAAGALSTAAKIGRK